MKKVLYILVMLLFVALFCYSAWQLIDYFYQGWETQSGYDKLAQQVQEARPEEDPTAPTIDWSLFEGLTPEEIVQMPDNPYITVQHPETGAYGVMLPEFEELYLTNPDVVGWIRIPDTMIDYPVVQRRDKVDYYLYRDFYGVQRVRGCIYVREACDVFKPSDNLVIYGHMMQDGTMFYDLSRYTQKDYWESHRYLHFDSLLRRQKYEIVYVFKTTASVGEGFAYHLFNDAESVEDYLAFREGCEENRLYDTGLSIQPGDKLITLSTCEYTRVNGRLVVVARLIEE